MKTILITGSRGYLGRWLVNKLLDLNKYNIRLLLEDITDIKSNIQNIDVLIHLAAKHPSDHENHYKINYKATKGLASLCSKNTHFVFLSTDYVFKEHKTEEYNEHSERKPETTYGLSKSLAEDFLIQSLPKSSIIRTSMLYGYYNKKRNNFIQFIMTQLKDNKSIELFTDVYTHPTHVEDLSNFIINVIINKVYGVFHACASDFVNRYKLAKLFCKVNGLNSDLLLPAIRGKANLPKNINMKPSKEFLEIANISLEEGLNYNFEKMEARYAI